MRKPRPVPEGYIEIFRPHFYSRRLGRLVRASEYGKKTFRLVVPEKA